MFPPEYVDAVADVVGLSVSLMILPFQFLGVILEIVYVYLALILEIVHLVLSIVWLVLRIAWMECKSSVRRAVRCAKRMIELRQTLPM